MNPNHLKHNNLDESGTSSRQPCLDLSPARQAELISFVNTLNSRELDKLIELAQKRLLTIRGIVPLPHELVVQIASYLDIRSILHCSQTCKAWRSTFQTPVVMRTLQKLNFPFHDIRVWGDLMQAFKCVYLRFKGMGCMEWEVTRLGDAPSIARKGTAEKLNTAAKKALAPPRSRRGASQPKHPFGDHETTSVTYDELGNEVMVPGPGWDPIQGYSFEAELMTDDGDDAWEDEGDDEYDSSDEEAHIHAWEIQNYARNEISLNTEGQVLADQRIIVFFIDNPHRGVEYRFFDTVYGTWYHKLDPPTNRQFVQRAFRGNDRFDGWFPLISFPHDNNVYVYNFQTTALEVLSFSSGAKSSFHHEKRIAIATQEAEISFWKWEDKPETKIVSAPDAAETRHIQRYLVCEATFKLYNMINLPEIRPTRLGMSNMVIHHVLYHPKNPDITYVFSVYREERSTSLGRWVESPITVHILKFKKYVREHHTIVRAFNLMHPTTLYAGDWWEIQPLLTEGLYALGHGINSAGKPLYDTMVIFDLVNGAISNLKMPIDQMAGPIRGNPYVFSGINSHMEFFRMDSEECFETLRENFIDVPPGTRVSAARPLFFPRHYGKYIDFRQPHDDMPEDDNQSVSTLTQGYAFVNRYPVYEGPEEEPYEMPQWEKLAVKSEMDMLEP